MNLVYLSDVSPYRADDGTRTLAGVHQSLGSAAMAFEQIAGFNGLGYERFERAADLQASSLTAASVLVLFTIGETPWSGEQREIIERRHALGELRLLGVHAASDSAYHWNLFGQLVGARFDGHPVTGELPIMVTDRAHPATAHLRDTWRFRDELYRFTELVRDARVLMAVDEAQLPEDWKEHLGDPAVSAPGTVGRARLPLAWCIERGPARSFYTALGHFVAAYEDAAFLQHLGGAVRWLTGP
jgi:hypothetical protein